MGELIQDMKVGVRQLVGRPGFAAAAILSLALGVGLSTTLFGVVNAVLFKSGGITAPERLVEVYSGASEEFPQLTSSYPDYLSIQSGVNAFDAVAAHAFVRGVLSTGGRPVLITGEAVTANYFDTLRVRMSAGRPFRDDEDRAAGSAPVVVVSHGLWQRQLGGRTDSVGTTLKLSGLDYTIIGVAPVDFPGTMPGIATDVWVPVTMVNRLEFTGMQWTGDNDPGTTRLDRRSTRWLFIKGRLAEGRTLEQARAQVEAVYAGLRTEYPLTNEKVRASLVSAGDVRFHPMVDGYVRAGSAALLSAVGVVLLIACANVASLLLSRGNARRREFAIRAAIGAGRGRLIRQLLSEGLVLAAAGGLCGVVVASWAGRVLGQLAASALPLRTAFDFSIDSTVLLFGLGVSMTTILLFGLAPAWSVSKPDLVPALKESAGGDAGGSHKRISVRDGLVVAQLSLSLVLLVSGALLTRGLLAAKGTDVGFDPTRVAALSFNLQMNGYDAARSGAFQDRLLSNVRALPGVVGASVTTRLPLATDVNMDGMTIPGHHGPTDDPTPIDSVAVGADYFSVVGVPIVAGRAFTEQDIAQGRSVAVVNEAMARRYWPNGSAVGQIIYSGGFDQPPIEIVGVARNHKVRSIGEEPRPYIHRPAERSRRIGLIVRTVGNAEAALPMLRDAVWALEPDVVFTEDVSAAEIAETTMAPTRMGAMLIGACGVLALLVAAVGLYGVIAYSVSLRTREVGIRMALGAEPGQVRRMILAHGARLALAGVVIGVAAAAAVGRLLETLLYGLSALDPVAYLVAASILLLVSAAANLAPALAASRVPPVTALRS